jgi:hypothetical protein
MNEEMSGLDREVMRERHHKRWPDAESGYCDFGCPGDWPCDTIRALDELDAKDKLIDALAAEDERLRGVLWSIASTADENLPESGGWMRDAASDALLHQEEVKTP